MSAARPSSHGGSERDRRGIGRAAARSRDPGAGARRYRGDRPACHRANRRRRRLMRRSGDDCFAYGGTMVGLAEALALLEARVRPVVGHEHVPLDQACGRLLAGPLVSPRDVPAFDNVAVDGFACRGEDLAAADATSLRLLDGRAAAGHPFAGQVDHGEALRVLTGAVMPAGADTVVMQEACAVTGEAVTVAGRREARDQPAPCRRGCSTRPDALRPGHAPAAAASGGRGRARPRRARGDGEAQGRPLLERGRDQRARDGARPGCASTTPTATC